MKMSLLGLASIRKLRLSIDNVISSKKGQQHQQPLKAFASTLFQLLAGGEKALDGSQALLNASLSRFDDERWDSMRDKLIEALEVYRGQAVSPDVFQTIVNCQKMTKMFKENGDVSTSSLTRFLIVVFSPK